MTIERRINRIKRILDSIKELVEDNLFWDKLSAFASDISSLKKQYNTLGSSKKAVLSLENQVLSLARTIHTLVLDFLIAGLETDINELILEEEDRQKLKNRAEKLKETQKRLSTLELHKTLNHRLLQLEIHDYKQIKAYPAAILSKKAPHNLNTRQQKLHPPPRKPPVISRPMPEIFALADEQRHLAKQINVQGKKLSELLTTIEATSFDNDLSHPFIKRLKDELRLLVNQELYPLITQRSQLLKNAAIIQKWQHSFSDKMLQLTAEEEEQRKQFDERGSLNDLAEQYQRAIAIEQDLLKKIEQLTSLCTLANEALNCDQCYKTLIECIQTLFSNYQLGNINVEQDGSLKKTLQEQRHYAQEFSNLIQEYRQKTFYSIEQVAVFIKYSLAYINKLITLRDKITHLTKQCNPIILLRIVQRKHQIQAAADAQLNASNTLINNLLKNEHYNIYFKQQIEAEKTRLQHLLEQYMTNGTHSFINSNESLAEISIQSKELTNSLKEILQGLHKIVNQENQKFKEKKDSLRTKLINLVDAQEKDFFSGVKGFEQYNQLLYKLSKIHIPPAELTLTGKQIIELKKLNTQLTEIEKQATALERIKDRVTKRLIDKITTTIVPLLAEINEYEQGLENKTTTLYAELLNYQQLQINSTEFIDNALNIMENLIAEQPKLLASKQITFTRVMYAVLDALITLINYFLGQNFNPQFFAPTPKPQQNSSLDIVQNKIKQLKQELKNDNRLLVMFEVSKPQ